MSKSKNTAGSKLVQILLRTLLVIATILVFLAGSLFIMLKKCCSDSNPAARDLFVTTILETGQLKFLANLVCSKEQIERIQAQNTMSTLDDDVDTSFFTTVLDEEIPTDDGTVEEFDENGIIIEEISGRTFFAKLMIIKDPSQVVLGSTHPDGNWTEYGEDLDVIVKNKGGIAGVNAGIYESTGNKGGKPLGVVVEDHKITYNQPTGLPGLYMIGFNDDDILIIKDISGMSPADFETYVNDEHIRDAHCFQEESSDTDNHFVSLIINGEPRSIEGKGSGTNPRTAIGQRADKAVMFLVTDGRGSHGHLGATAGDLISILLEHGAVNAANLDGGSSSTMVYHGEYEMPSVTFYYQNSSWKLPTAFVVMPK